MLNTVIGGVPALRSYSNGGSTTQVSYPMKNGGPDNPTEPGSPGTFYNPIALSGAPDAIVEFEVWRPQRRAIEGSGEGSDWIDMGGLLYTVDTANTGSGAAGGELCPGSALSEDSSELATEAEGIRDLTLDAPANPARTLKFTVNLSECLRAAGRDWPAGEKVKVFFVASSEARDRASGGGFYFTRG